LFIAAHAKSLDAVIVTNNTREFERKYIIVNNLAEMY
jgi:predicted nucleic acid-binding protein